VRQQDEAWPRSCRTSLWHGYAETRAARRANERKAATTTAAESCRTRSGGKAKRRKDGTLTSRATSCGECPEADTTRAPAGAYWGCCATN